MSRMSKIFILLLLISSLLRGQDDKYLPLTTGIIVHSHFILKYNEANEIADWVAYELTSAEASGDVARTNDFREDVIIPTKSASLRDYKNSGYDRGHLAPAGDMAFSLTAMSESFLLSNIVPQNSSNNRGIWRRLENRVRSWAQTENKLYVITGTITDPRRIGLGRNKVAVPTHLYKIVYDEADQEMIAFSIPNSNVNDKELSYYVTTVDKIEALTGIDFFHQLDENLQDRIESSFDLSGWPITSSSVKRSSSVAIGNDGKPKLATSSQCKGLAKSTGNRCRNKTKNSNGYCHLHQVQFGNPIPTGSSSRSTFTSRCTAITKAGTRCKRTASKGSLQMLATQMIFTQPKIILMKRILSIILISIGLSLIYSCSDDAVPCGPNTGTRVGAICNDGWRSNSTGSGTCSSHGGVDYWLCKSND